MSLKRRPLQLSDEDTVDVDAHRRRRWAGLTRVEGMNPHDIGRVLLRLSDRDPLRAPGVEVVPIDTRVGRRGRRLDPDRSLFGGVAGVLAVKPGALRVRVQELNVLPAHDHVHWKNCRTRRVPGE